MQPRPDPSLTWASSDSSIAKTIPRFRTETPWRDAAAGLELARAPQRSARSIISELGFELEQDDAPEHDGTLRGIWRARMPWLVIGGALLAWVAFHHAHRADDATRAVTTPLSVPSAPLPAKREDVAHVDQVEHVPTTARHGLPAAAAQSEQREQHTAQGVPERSPVTPAKASKARRARPRNRAR